MPNSNASDVHPDALPKSFTTIQKPKRARDEKKPKIRRRKEKNAGLKEHKGKEGSKRQKVDEEDKISLEERNRSNSRAAQRLLAEMKLDN